jgi:hypothetical protein
MLALNGLQVYHHPVFYSENFLKTTDDGFFVSILAEDSKFDLSKSQSFLESIGGKDVEVLKADDDS